MNWDPHGNFLFTKEEYAVAKQKDYLPIICMHCKEEGVAQKSAIKRAMTIPNSESAKFCSNECRNRVAAIRGKEGSRRVAILYSFRQSLFAIHSALIRRNIIWEVYRKLYFVSRD